MFARIIRTEDDWGAFVARLALALVIFPHGAQKALGWFGGFGPAGTIGFMGTLGVPAALAWVAIAAEFLGSLALVIGLLGRVAAFGIMVNMIVATLTVHLPNGFFMNWTGQQRGEGFEFFLLAIGLALVVIIKGSGVLSADRGLTRRLVWGGGSRTTSIPRTSGGTRGDLLVRLTP